MLEFRAYSPENLIAVSPLIAQSPLLCSDVSLGAFLMWNQGLGVEFAVYHNTFIAKVDIGDEPAFSYPFGEDVDGALDALCRYTAKQDTALTFYAVNEELLASLKADKRFDSVCANYDRRWSDYLYSFEEMTTFAGRKFSGQRNHINRFKKTYGEPDLRPIQSADIPAIHEMLAEYRQHHSGGGMEKAELEGTYTLLDRFADLGMIGCVLYVDDKVAGFTIGELVGTTFVIHVEKALTVYTGVYPTLFHHFMRYIRTHIDQPILLVNREDDSGDLGLRTSKMQYQPIRILHKFMVRVNSPLCKIGEIGVISFDGGVLTELEEFDKANYFALCTDKTNNQYWGYDYENDRYITEVDENTFFDSQKYDRSLGASVTFAVREREGGELVGETIVYRFTAGGHAEIGGRIAASHQGKGLGTKAFAATADFAERVLRVKPVAKCYKPNLPSAHMIRSAGFRQVGEDDTFYYFER
ncbi:MAG: GNAT family N-acetyltransferase [Clostridia bacterium]|nr:GNAT family N-acetyltransferase [Clostridia bacterium]